MSYVLPSFPPDARFAGLVSSFNDPARRNKLQATIAATIRDHQGALYSLAMPPGQRVGDDALAAMGLARTTCEEIVTNLRASPAGALPAAPDLTRCVRTHALKRGTLAADRVC